MIEEPQSEQRCLSVVVPCFNEADTIGEILNRVLASPHVGEVIVVDDASTDGTLDIARRVVDERVRIVAVEQNRGKGAALREGFRHATMEFVIVQDADLEYNPDEYGRILRPLLAGDADVVYGSRFKGSNEQRVLYFWHSLGNRLLTLASNVATNLNLTDMETCYKAFRREVIQAIELEEDRFGFEPEVTAKLAARRVRIFEVGISYHGRTYEEGKKVGWRDGVRAGYCILAYSPLGGVLRIRRLHRVLEVLTGA
ncbi:MAG: glycosyltransferase family 2 protein [Ilumatobacter sp.]|uniref:glycosyltransferase family 2 protein n=1 Tax=Ilumatobacter sp. TaxID=1967498 RepID=UPI00329878EF